MIIEAFAACNYTLNLLLNTYRKHFTANKINPLVTTGISNLFGHPIVFVFLALVFGIYLPGDKRFYFGFGVVIFLTLVSFYFMFHGYTKTLFSGAMFIQSTSFLFSVIGAVLFLGEKLSIIKWLAVFGGLIGCLILTFPQKEAKKFKFDPGLILVLIGTIIMSASFLFYKYASSVTQNYIQFLEGRLVVDFIFYSIVMIFVYSFLKTEKFFKQKGSVSFIILVNINTLLGSYFVFALPASTLSMLSTIILPLSFLFGKIKYKEQPKFRIYAGSFIIFVSLLIFILV